ncbi:hypothetical protein GUITHDRAFT_133774 [Guillardia theta CCMP2712]|uniref:C2 domain-containing protein n=1 Tax=Guillardia theta (strain CCMP2712) TaxID=905079 RepID=L1JW05_GUITC|nr:hypothetical protein GUITHDRAFT_133774 [Guillardia theta CCMP2712]EKX52761.1 hypothetical protein GUITHDRAFT_133774 [Guillardia theta CCMP2712]|eukprot:XP_005839741.1 hypothetical protein GUITHDRAFT_133774 [Guillardia theta CCMP2712]
MAQGKLKGYVSMITLSKNKFFVKKSSAHHCDHSLVLACASGAAAEVCRLMEVTDPSKCDQDGVYPLTAAIKEGQWGVVEILLENKRMEVNVEDACGLSPLILCIENATKNASKHGSAIVCLGKLLDHGARLDVQDRSGRGAIEIALREGQGQMALMLIQRVKMLTDKSADSSRPTETFTSWSLTVSNMRALDLPQMNSRGTADVLAKISVGEGIHQTRVMRNSLCPEWTDSCEFEVSSSTKDELVFQLYRWDRSGHDELLCEVRLPLIDTQRYPKQLIDKQFSLAPSKTIRTAATHTARVQFSVHSSYPLTDVETAKSLVTSSQLVLASLLDDPDALSCMEMLLSLRADVNDRDSSGASPLTHVLRSGRLELASCLLNAKADPNHVNKEEGNSAWSTVAGMCSSGEMTLALSEMLLAHGIHPNAPLMIDGQWETPLTYAVKTEQATLLSMILRHAGDPNLSVREALAGLEIQGDDPAARLHPLCLAMQGGNIDNFLVLVHDESLRFDLVWERGPEEAAAAEDLPPVSFACLQRHHQQLRMLLSHPQSSSRLQDARNGRQALRMAARSDSIDCLQLLVSFMPDLREVSLLHPAMLEAIRSASSSSLVFLFHILSASRLGPPGPEDIYTVKLAAVKEQEKQKLLMTDERQEGRENLQPASNHCLDSLVPLAVEDLEETKAGEIDRNKSEAERREQAEDGSRDFAISRHVGRLFDQNQVRSLLMEAIPFSSTLLWLLLLFADNEKETWDLISDVCHEAISLQRWSSVEVLLKLQGRKDCVSSSAFSRQLLALLKIFTDLQTSCSKSLSTHEAHEYVKSFFLIFRTSPPLKLELGLEVGEGRTMLHLAAQLGWLPVVERLTELGAFSVADENGNEPVAVAAMNLQQQVCEHLVQRFHPPHVVLRWSADSPVCVEEQHGDLLAFSVARGWTKVSQALVSSLIEKLAVGEQNRAGGSDWGSEITGRDAEAELRGHVRMAVRMAATHGWLQGLSLIFSAFPAEQEEWNQHDELPLLALAAIGGHADCLKFLVKQEASGIPLALIAGSIRGDLPVTSSLFEGFEEQEAASKTNVRLKQLRSLKDLALLLSCYCGSLQVSNFLLSQGADPNHRANIPHEIMRWLSCEEEYPELVGLEEASAKTKFLLLTISRELSARLVQAQADIDGMSSDAIAPLTAAAMHGNQDIVVLLIKQGAALDPQKMRIVNLLEFGKVRRLWQRLVMACLKAGKFSKLMSENAKSSIFIPPSTGSFATEKSFGAKTKYVAATPLMWSILRKQEECSRILIECGADHNLVKEFFESETLSAVLHHNIDPLTRHELRVNGWRSNLRLMTAQDKIDDLADYSLAAVVSVPPPVTRDAFRTTTGEVESDEETTTSPFDLRQLEGNKYLVPSNRRLQAIHFLYGISASELEDMQFWTLKPKNGSFFFLIVPSDAFTFSFNSGTRSESCWYGTADQTETEIATVKCENRELVGAQVIHGRLDSTCVKSIRIYSRLRYPQEYLRGYRRDAVPDPETDESHLEQRQDSKESFDKHKTLAPFTAKTVLSMRIKHEEEFPPVESEPKKDRPSSAIASAPLTALDHDHDRVLRIYCVKRSTVRLSVQRRPLIPRFRPLLSSREDRNVVERLTVEEILQRAMQKSLEVRGDDVEVSDEEGSK